jgi:asparagine synthetase A
MMTGVPLHEWFKGLNEIFCLANQFPGCTAVVVIHGSRVDRDALVKHWIWRLPERKTLLFHKMLLSNQLPLSVGGHGLSRL